MLFNGKQHKALRDKFFIANTLEHWKYASLLEFRQYSSVQPVVVSSVRERLVLNWEIDGSNPWSSIPLIFKLGVYVHNSRSPYFEQLKKSFPLLSLHNQTYLNNIIFRW